MIPYSSSRIIIVAIIVPFFHCIHGVIAGGNTPLECTLSCLNGGRCMFGEINDDFSSMLEDAFSDGDETTPISIINRFDRPRENIKQSCLCPKGYTGLKCEIKLKGCYDDQKHTCANGSPCRRNIHSHGEIYHHCGCDVTQSDMTVSPFTPQMCEHLSSTVFCTADGRSVTDPSQARTATTTTTTILSAGTTQQQQDQQYHHGFCVNDGVCNGPNNCKCTKEWDGPHCEFLKSEYLMSRGQKMNEEVNGIVFIVFFCGMLGIGLISMVAFAIIQVSKMKKSKLRRVQTYDHYLETSMRGRCCGNNNNFVNNNITFEDESESEGGELFPPQITIT